MSGGPAATQTSLSSPKEKNPTSESGTDYQDHVGNRGDLPEKSGLEGKVHTAGPIPVS